MQHKFQKHLDEHFPFLNGKKLLLALSGGIDSVVMVDLFQKMHYDIALAHCNFQLRDMESFDDQQFVQSYADTNEIPLFTTQFDTKAFAQDYKLSTQVAARELRYNWFYELLADENYDFLLTAHHADDNMETFFIHLSRGTGLDGLTGIPQQNEQVIRPLLPFSRAEIEAYAKQNQLQWREDSSNASDDYLRNKIRHQLVPVLQGLNPDLLENFKKTQSYLREAQTMVEDASIMIYQQVAQEANEEIHFNLKKLKQLTNYKSYLYHWLREYAFSDWAAIYDLVESQSGKQIFSQNYRLLKNRNFLIVSQIAQNNNDKEYTIAANQKEVNFPLKMTFCKVDEISTVSKSTIFVDEDRLIFPLQLRRWRKGDSFHPLGMNGQSKKVSKFFKDEKLSLLEKENTWLLCCGNQIVWIVGFREDERFKIEKTTQHILKIDLL